MMMMMNMEVAAEEVVGSNDNRNIVKGKRTKRQRPSSPLGIASSTGSSTGGGESGGGDGARSGGEYEHIIPSPGTSAEFAESMNEEEDMANCLILLAQGHGRESPKRIHDEGDKMDRLSSRRFTEAATTTSGKTGIYVYECKTCNRCFPSFQALGGHRASHKKPKAMVEEKKALLLYEEEGEVQGEGQFNKSSSPSLPLHIGDRPLNSTNNKARVHECSICGSEFSSGQALGGHMRRHRTSSAATNTSMTLNSLTPSEPQKPKKPRNILSLDLNLPAPEDDHREPKFPFSSKQQPLLFSASALVDCHY